MDLIEDIGPILGIVAFLGFAILAILIVLQAREVRRLREWAGRAPERSAEADEADRAVAEARGDLTPEEERGERFSDRVADRLAAGWAAFDRRSPVDPRWLVALLLALVVAGGVVTSGFGLFGDDGAPAPREERGGGGGGGGGSGSERQGRPTVAVLNATQVSEPVPVDAVPGIADVVAQQVVEPAGFRVVERTNAPAGEEASIIMFEPDAESDATELAEAVEPDLGATETVPMEETIRALAGGADLVLLVGQDDAELGGGAVAP